MSLPFSLQTAVPVRYALVFISQRELDFPHNTKDILDSSWHKKDLQSLQIQSLMETESSTPMYLIIYFTFLFCMPYHT